MRRLTVARWVVLSLVAAGCTRAGENPGAEDAALLRVRLGGIADPSGALATLVVRNVFDPAQVRLVECLAKNHALDGQSFCDELITVAPGVYEILVQSVVRECRSERDHYKVLVEKNRTVEVPITLVCRSHSGGLDVVVTTRSLPSIQGLSFTFDLGGRANKYMCFCGDDVRAEVQVSDADSPCGALEVRWSAVDESGLDATAQLLSAPASSETGGTCRYSILVDANADPGSYLVTFAASDGRPPASALTFPIHLITCGSGCASCPEGLELCEDACVETATDEGNCGACGVECGPNEACEAGACVDQGCPPDYVDCGGTCVKTSTSPLHCGSCGYACATGQYCVSGQCLTTCIAPLTACNGTCVDTSGDPHHCGSCGNVCPVGQVCQSGACTTQCIPGVIDGVNLGGLTSNLFVFTDGSGDAIWQGSTKGYVGDVAVDGIQAVEKTSGSLPYAGTISTNAASLGPWQGIVTQSQNVGQAFAALNKSAKVSQLEADLSSAFAQINALVVSPGYAGVASTSLNGLNAQNGLAQTFVINVTSGFSVSTKIHVTGDAGDVFILRWDTDQNFANGYNGQVSFQSGGAIVPHGGLKPTNFIHVAGDLASSGGGSTPPPPYPQGPRLGDGLGPLINGGTDFAGGGFFTGYWLTTGDPAKGVTSALTNAIFVGGWYTRSTKFTLTSGTSGVFVSQPCP